MRIAIIGGGAIGSLIAARLAATAEVTLVVRRTEAAAEIAAHGIRMTTPEGAEVVARVRTTADPAIVGAQQVVALCTKAYALESTLPALKALSGPDTAVLPVINGIPWWYPAFQPAPLAGRSLTSVDPSGALAAAIDPQRIVGALTYVAVLNQGDGRIRHAGNQKFVFGDPAGRDTPALRLVTQAFAAAGFAAESSAEIRSHIWTKLWGNLAFNPLSVITEARLTTLCTEPAAHRLVSQVMAEAEAVASRLGVSFGMSIPDRIAATAKLGDFKTSMLQDYEAGRRLELEAIVGAVIELAALVGVPVPTIEALITLARLRAER